MKHYTRCLPCEQVLKANALVGSSAGGKSPQHHLSLLIDANQLLTLSLIEGCS